MLSEEHISPGSDAPVDSDPAVVEPLPSKSLSGHGQVVALVLPHGGTGDVWAKIPGARRLTIAAVRMECFVVFIGLGKSIGEIFTEISAMQWMPGREEGCSALDVRAALGRLPKTPLSFCPLHCGGRYGISPRQH